MMSSKANITEFPALFTARKTYFSWHSIDFEGDVSVRDVLRRFGPEKHAAFLKKAEFRIKYKDYHWGLNDQSGLGKDYEHSIFNSLF